MRRLRKWLSLSPPERRLFREALLLLGIIRLALWVLPFRKVHDFVLRYRRRNEGLNPHEIAPAVIGGFIDRAARLVPRATCLTQALAAQVMLARRGHSSVLHFGGKTVAGKFTAHAWVEAEGTIVVGEAVSGEFSGFQKRQGGCS